MVTQSVSTQLVRRLCFSGLIALLGISTGCMTPKPNATAVPQKAAPNPIKQASATEDLPAPKPVPQVQNQAPAKPGEAARLTAAFNNKVIYAPDPTRGGDPVPGILGRIYVFSTDESVPIIADGEVVVDVWDNSPKIHGGKPKLMEVWHIDKDSFAKFRKRDIIGEGYSLFLPWSTYNIDVKQINVIVRYTGTDGRVLTSPPEQLAIDHATTLQRAAEKVSK